MIILAIILTVISIAVFNTDIKGLAIALVFVVLYIQLPGMLITKVLKLKIEHISTALAVGFFIGYAFVISQYYASELINSNILLYTIGPICSIFYIVSLIKARNKMVFYPSRISPLVYVFTVIVLLFAMLYTQFDYMAPEASGYIRMHHDFAYHFGIINTLAEGLPADNPWVYGDLITYHYYTEMLFAVALRLFGLTADFMIMSVSPYLIAYAFSVTLYSLFREFLTCSKKVPLYCIIVLASFPFITNTIDSSWMLYHLFSNMNSFCFAACGTFVFIVLLKMLVERLNEGNCYLSETVVLLAMIMLVTGIKGPVGLVIVGALWGTMILGSILRKLDLKMIPVVLLLTLGFFVVYYFIIGMGGTTGTNGKSLITLAEIVKDAFFFDQLTAFMKGLGLPSIITKVALVTVYMMCVLTAFFLPAVIGYVKEFFGVVTGKIDFRFDLITIYAAIAAGFIAMMLLNYNGNSQVYFGFTAMCLVPLIVFRYFENTSVSRNAVRKVIKVLFCMTLIVTTCLAAASLNTQMRSSNIYLGLDDRGIGADDVTTLSSYEYEAMMYIRDNIDKDTLIATDRYYSVPIDEFDYTDRRHCRFFLYAGYSEHDYYMEGTGYTFKSHQSDIRKEYIDSNARLFDPENEDRGQIARDMGIGYVVVSKRFADTIPLENEDYKLIFNNKDIDIYEVVRKN